MDSLHAQAMVEKRKRRKSDESNDHRLDSDSEIFKPLRKVKTISLGSDSHAGSQVDQSWGSKNSMTQSVEQHELTPVVRMLPAQTYTRPQNPTAVVSNYFQWLKNQESDVRREFLVKERQADLALGIDWRVRDETEEDEQGETETSTKNEFSCRQGNNRRRRGQILEPAPAETIHRNAPRRMMQGEHEK